MTQIRARDASREALEHVEERTQALGRALLAAAEGYRPGAAERTEDWLLTHAVADERFRSRLLRYMDVLASLDYDAGGHEAKRLAREYFAADFPELPRALRWLLRVARNEHLPAPLVGETARRAASVFARRFITPPGEDTVRATTEYLAERGRYPSFDLLGEAVLSDAEAQQYVEGYLQLIERLSRDPAAHARTPGGEAALQVSLKLSSLTPHFTPVDVAGSAERVQPRLQRIADAARDAGVGITVDAEQYEFRDLTWEVFRRTFGRGEPHGTWPDVGIVLQCYLRDAHEHAGQMVAFARERSAPFQVRLVKGAYWDYETIVAAANRWPTPVFTQKSATDAQFERVCAMLVDAHPHLRLAVGSHNARAHAVAEALAEAGGLPAGAVEHQTLFRTAEDTSRALVELGWPARDYVPVGELLPGMAYLVRRVLENSSQAGFLLQSRSGANAETLLRAPAARSESDPGPDPEPGLFQRAPSARWFDAAFVARFEQALASTRARWGERYELTVGDTPARPDEVSEVAAVHSPSHPDGESVGHVVLANEVAAARAVAVATAGAHRWAATAVGERAAVLRRAGRLLHERSAEFAAWVVHEGGRDRADAFAEVEEAVDYLNYYAAQAEQLFGRFGDRIAPRGAVAVVPPWNFSLAIPCGMTVAALACGNAAILKPAGQTPLIAHRLVALLHEAGVPSEALICLPGSGGSVGRALVESPGVAMVAFTGSREVGTWMHEAVAQVELEGGGAKALLAEMGGKNPVLVFADADLDEAVAGILRSAFGHANQKCSAASRVLVEAPIAERLRSRLVEAARSLEVGPADAPSTQVNPIIDRAAYERLLEAAAVARSECEVLLDRFEQPSGPLELGPLIVQLPPGRALEAKTATEELFGPILVLIPFEREEEAYRIANGTAYGLTAGVFSRSPETIERAARALEAGTVYVNRVTTGARVGVEPFGGMRMSGTGPKAGGPDYLWAFVRRTDLPEHEAEAAGAPEEATTAAEEPHPAPAAALAPELRAVERGWRAPLEQRLDAVEGAAVLLGSGGHPDATALLSAAQAARRELGLPVPTVQVPGQRTELRYETPRGLGLVRARGEHAASWLAAGLLAGNAVLVLDSPSLAAAVMALLRAGVPPEVLRIEGGGRARMLELAAAPEVAFAVVDGDRPFARELWRRLGPTAEGQRSLKALLSPLDGPQPGEPGFLHRFAWPKVVAVRTLRHGADLALDPATEPRR